MAAVIAVVSEAVVVVLTIVGPLGKGDRAGSITAGSPAAWEGGTADPFAAGGRGPGATAAAAAAEPGGDVGDVRSAVATGRDAAVAPAAEGEIFTAVLIVDDTSCAGKKNAALSSAGTVEETRASCTAAAVFDSITLALSAVTGRLGVRAAPTGGMISSSDVVVPPPLSEPLLSRLRSR